ncbi:MlaC/ttg2D family ABC transporter substrate-binding protein [Pseudoxanthomonas koreensis]|uniref:MlaC/ttg2D family ABC transporter substrate-binding protein n=1 Tax=Pseudoxanthomonas koreensis TaxID=266061 RepID=UPI00139151A7|nr:ABC transporter substrate-binding protein [Pseudoxanthomonas koreensis]KAF1694191.1 organic solvent ABC transporter [Pseudoxanthomonas koreensis]
MKPLILSLALALPLLAAAPDAARAQQATATAPAAAGKQVVANGTRILDTLQQRPAEFQKNPAAPKAFVNSELSAAFDREYAARLVLGPHGRGASDADVKLFADAMTDNLMQRYGAALVNIEGKPRIRLKSETALPGNRGFKVSTEVVRDGGNPIPVDYLVRDNGGWKIFDAMVEGVSYVQTFRSQFDAPLRQKSIAQVAADLRAGALQPQAE